MAVKIKVKLILEVRAAQLSQREICRTRKMSQHSVGDVCKHLHKRIGYIAGLRQRYMLECLLQSNDL